MPQLHNETPSAQNKRLKAELANERALCGELIEALEEIVSPLNFMQRRAAEKGHNLSPMAAPLCDDAAYLRAVAGAALAQANGKGL